ncbi:sensor histidine kinase [Marinobacter halotolerans]|uniref:sensor histidine kinase n=1 Tax=Marinobacter halotolerans TaxID=1569211 RepID=UPI0012467877|nr:ATP-binding protein [Marinobacter halotolerans]
MSLTRTLTLMVTTLVLLLAMTAALWSYFESNHELEELFDAELAQSTRIVQGLVRYLSETRSPVELTRTLRETLQIPHAALSESDFGEILSDGSGHKYEKKLSFEIWTPDGTALLNTLSSDATPPAMPGYHWIDASGFRWRTFSMRDPETGFWLRTAQREDIRDELSQELAMGNVLPLLVIVPLLLIAIPIAIRSGFQPLRRLEAPLADMEPQHLYHLDTTIAPKEVHGLVTAVNTLLGRLNEALAHERSFSADAAHELRTPLSALRLNLEHMATRPTEDLSDLMESVDRMTHLVDQLLLLSRIDRIESFERLPNNLSAIVEQSVADIAPLALNKQIEPVLHSDLAELTVDCNSALINTLMRSVLANAIQYGPSGSTIDISILKEKDNAEIWICDEGPGIAEEERDRALRRFSRLDQRVGKGSGLGLAIARRIAELHNGHLSLENRPDNRGGLCVHITLPVANDS